MSGLTKHTPLTVKDKALRSLAKRKLRNAKIKPIDNSSLRAGSSMYFYCLGCRAEIRVPEDYITRPQHCDDCQRLINAGWLK